MDLDNSLPEQPVRPSQEQHLPQETLDLDSNSQVYDDKPPQWQSHGQNGHKPAKKPLVNEWVKPQPERRPDQEWHPKPDWQKPQHESYPRPETQGKPVVHNQCKVIPNNLRNVDFTPIVKVGLTYSSTYKCDSRSVINQLSYGTSNPPSGAITCNGIIVNKNNDRYQASVWGQQHDVDDKLQQIETLYIVNYTQISTFNNGNLDYLECGSIQGGRCHGDLIWGTGLYKVNNDQGCVQGGIYQNKALFRRIQILGKCASRCSLGSSTLTYSELVFNGGIWDTDPNTKRNVRHSYGLELKSTNETVFDVTTTTKIY